MAFAHGSGLENHFFLGILYHTHKIMTVTCLVACEYSGSVRSRLRELGVDAFSCDILDAEDGSQYHIKADAIET